MPSVNDLLILASRDMTLCEKVEPDFPDEYAVSAAAYHIQQAIEKLIKALILIHGEYPAFTHNIVKLIAHCEKLGIEIPKELDEVADALSLWKTNTRYDPEYPVSNKKYQKAKIAYSSVYEKVNAFIQNCNAGENQDNDETEDSGMQMI